MTAELKKEEKEALRYLIKQDLKRFMMLWVKMLYGVR